MSEDAHKAGVPFFSDEDLQVMRRNVPRYFVKLLFCGRSDSLEYQVDKDTSERIRRNVSGEPSGFCCFTTCDGREVAVNLARLDYAHFLWDAALPELELVEHWPASVYFSGRQEAFCFDPPEEDEAFHVFFTLEACVDPHDPFMAISDEDGEVVVFDARHVDAIEMSAELVAEGAARFDAELNDDAGSSDGDAG